MKGLVRRRAALTLAGILGVAALWPALVPAERASSQAAAVLDRAPSSSADSGGYEATAWETERPPVNAGAGFAFAESAPLDANARLVSRSESIAPVTPGRGQATPETVIGTDDRVQITGTTAYPYSTVVHLEMNFSGSLFNCSGTLIGPNAVVTAAHCLYNSDFGGHATDIWVIPGRNGASEPFGFQAAIDWGVPNGWISLETPDYDWGIITLPSSSLGDAAGWRWLSVFEDGVLGAADFTPAMAGYPGDKSYGTMWYGSKPSFFLPFIDPYLDYLIDSFGGQSGSGIYSDNPFSPAFRHVVGVHAYGLTTFNSGRRIDETIINSFASYCATAGCTFSTYTQGDPYGLDFVAGPLSEVAMAVFSVAPVVHVLDSGGSLVSTDNATTVTLSKLSGPGSLTCTGGTTRVVAAGQVTFDGCSLSAPGTYVLRAEAPGLYFADTPPITITVPTGPPPPPTYDRITALSSSSLQLHWADNATNEEFYLAYRIAPGPSVQVGGSLPAGTTSVTHTGLTSNTQYFYQVYAWNQTASVFPGTYMAGRTLNNSPAPPRVLAAWGTSTSSIRINWQDNSNNEQGFRVQRWNGSGFTLAGTTGSNVTTFTDTSGLSAGAGYYYIVQSFNADGATNSLGGISALTFASTPGTPPGPAAPSYTGASSTSTTATINWTDNASDEQFYLVYRIAPGPSTLIATLNPNSTSFQDTGLTAGTQYYYQVYAWNGSGSNTAGSFIVAKTLSTYPNAPNLQSAAAKSSTSMKVTWIDKSTTETGFRVLRYNGSGWDLAGTTAANATSFIDTGLTPGTSYVYLVTSFNSAGESWAPDAVWAPTLP